MKSDHLDLHCTPVNSDTSIDRNSKQDPFQHHNNIVVLQRQITELETENDFLRRERELHRREISNLKRSIRRNDLSQISKVTFARMRGQVETMKREREMFLFEMWTLEDQLRYLQFENQAKDCKIRVLDELLTMMKDEFTQRRRSELNKAICHNDDSRTALTESLSTLESYYPDDAIRE